ncbi:hypothetical protein AVEN_205260-1 [Araneus ventricosus]|uniref:Uncharacterized protein n=1 Tax=Araneus ventricosus TaxID=182803 RepID=A0A4Y2EEA9_ARAVE|nr:hypothetical protein AVEN_205260-1 [Araneus ventricosus]
MAFTPQQRSQCVIEFAEKKSGVQVKRAFKQEFDMDKSKHKFILKWHETFVQTRCICDERRGHSGWPSVSEDLVDACRVTDESHVQLFILKQHQQKNL